MEPHPGKKRYSKRNETQAPEGGQSIRRSRLFGGALAPDRLVPSALMGNRGPGEEITYLLCLGSSESPRIGFSSSRTLRLVSCSSGKSAEPLAKSRTSVARTSFNATCPRPLFLHALSVLVTFASAWLGFFPSTLGVSHLIYQPPMVQPTRCLRSNLLLLLYVLKASGAKQITEIDEDLPTRSGSMLQTQKQLAP